MRGPVGPRLLGFPGAPPRGAGQPARRSTPDFLLEGPCRLRTGRVAVAGRTPRRPRPRPQAPPTGCAVPRGPTVPRPTRRQTAEGHNLPQGGGPLDKDASAAWQRRKEAATRAEPLPVVLLDGPGHEVLRAKAKPVKHTNRRLRELIDRMWATMYAHDGVGLAAPQIGISQRVIVVDAGTRHMALINPEMVAGSGSQTEPMEGCLSIPDLIGEVERFETVRIRGLDPDGREVWVDAEGYLARALQHEIDHLDGVLFTDRARRVVRPSPETKLDVVFLGSSDFGAEVLRVCLEGDVVPRLVVTQPDRPAGRGLRLRPTAVRLAAQAAEIEVLTPEKARDPSLLERVRALNPEVLVTAAYGQIVPQSLLDLARVAALNVHPSLLPLYRGPDPIRRALWNGDRETGLTIQFMSREVDAGDILVQERVEIAPDENGGDLAARLATLGGEALVRALRLLATGKAVRQPQDHAGATRAPKIAPEEEVADFTLPAETLAARVRALAPRPGLRTPGGLKILRAVAMPGDVSGAAPGQAMAVRAGEGLVVATGHGLLLLREVQPAGGRRMDAAAYANGRRLVTGQEVG